MSLKETIQRHWPNLRIPVRNAVIAAVCMAVASLFMSNHYEAQVRILPDTGSSSLDKLAALNQGLALLGAGSADDATATYPDVLKSRWVDEQLLKKSYSYQEASWYFGSPRPYIQTLLDYLGEKNIDRGMKTLSGVMKIDKDIRTNLLTLSVDTKSPQLSQQVAHDALALLDAFLKTQNQTHGRETAKFTSERLKVAESDYQGAERQMAVFLNVNRNYGASADPEVRLKGQRLAADLKLREDLIASLTLNHEQALLQAANDTPVLNVLDDANLPIEKSRPHRALLVLLVMFLVGLGSWFYQGRAWLRERFFEPGR